MHRLQLHHSKPCAGAGAVVTDCAFDFHNEADVCAAPPGSAGPSAAQPRASKPKQVKRLKKGSAQRRSAPLSFEIDTLTGKTIPVCPQDGFHQGSTVSDLKLWLQDREGVPPHLQRLTLKYSGPGLVSGEGLADDSTLGSCQVVTGSIRFLSISIRVLSRSEFANAVRAAC
jgi:Ubiquitin family